MNWSAFDLNVHVVFDAEMQACNGTSGGEERSARRREWCRRRAPSSLQGSCAARCYIDSVRASTRGPADRCAAWG